MSDFFKPGRGCRHRSDLSVLLDSVKPHKGDVTTSAFLDDPLIKSLFQASAGQIKGYGKENPIGDFASANPMQTAELSANERQGMGLAASGSLPSSLQALALQQMLRLPQMGGLEAGQQADFSQEPDIVTYLQALMTPQVTPGATNPNVAPWQPPGSATTPVSPGTSPGTGPNYGRGRNEVATAQSQAAVAPGAMTQGQGARNFALQDWYAKMMEGKTSALDAEGKSYNPWSIGAPDASGNRALAQHSTWGSQGDFLSDPMAWGQGQGLKAPTDAELSPYLNQYKNSKAASFQDLVGKYGTGNMGAWSAADRAAGQALQGGNMAAQPEVAPANPPDTGPGNGARPPVVPPGGGGQTPGTTVVPPRGGTEWPGVGQTVGSLRDISRISAQTAAPTTKESLSRSITNSPTVQAALDAFNQTAKPTIQNEMNLSGLGRSTATANALSQGQTQMMLPLIQDEYSRQERANAARTAATQQSIQDLLGLSGAQTSQNQNAVNQLMQTGGVERGVQQSGYEAAMQDYLRRQGLSEQATFGPFGQLVPSAFGSRQIGK